MKHSETYVQFARFAEQLADGAGHIARNSFRRTLNVRQKADKSSVTEVDQDIEKFLRERIKSEYHSHGVIGEEQQLKVSSSDFIWVLDPIDGTESYIHGVPLYGILIGLLHQGHPILGVADMPQLGERWVSLSGSPTRLNGEIVSARQNLKLHQAAVFTTDPDRFRKRERKVLDDIRSVVRIVRYGGDCYSYCLLATGLLDAVIECGLEPYDYLPLVPIVESAGGVVSDWEGKRLTVASDGRVLASANQDLHLALLRIIHRRRTSTKQQ